MSEKRFKRGYNLSCVDTETGKSYWYACNLCGLLNEQQAIIEALKRENDKLYHWKSNDSLKDMSEERFYELTSSIDYYQIWDKQEDKGYTIEDAVDKLNSLVEENEQLRTQLAICQQSKNDNGGFQVWEVPPIPKGKRISFTTNNDGGDGV